MKVTYHTTGNAMLEFDAVSEKETVEQLAFWQSLPENCPRCQSALRFFFRSPQGNDYYGLICAGTPAHETNFGQFKAGGLYYKNQWQDAFAGGFNPEREEQAREIANFDRPEAESKTEHTRLDGQLADEWKKGKYKQTFESSVRERFGVSPDKLTISQKRGILEKLQKGK